MRGGSLTCYYPPVLRGQQGDGLTERLIRIVAPVILELVRAGQRAIDQGQSWRAAGKAAGRALKCRAQQSSASKKAKRLRADVFDQHKFRHTVSTASPVRLGSWRRRVLPVYKRTTTTSRMDQCASASIATLRPETVMHLSSLHSSTS